MEEEELSIQSQLSKELEEICNAAVQEVSGGKCSDGSPSCADNVKVETGDVKVEHFDVEGPTTEPVTSSVLSQKPANTPLMKGATSGGGQTVVGGDVPATADEATQNLINNLSNITSISEINEITELTQSLVESLVQVTNTFYKHYNALQLNYFTMSIS